MPQRIPDPLIAILAGVLENAETHGTMNQRLMYAGAPGDPPEGNKLIKATESLRRVNDSCPDPLEVVGRLIEDYMEADEEGPGGETIKARRQVIERALIRAELRYLKGGRIVGNVATPSRSLAAIIESRDLKSVDEEFARALDTVEAKPREAVSAACNILEAVCKTFIEDEGLAMPAKQDLQGVWGVVRKKLGFDPSTLQDQDLQKIITGLLSIVDGIGALRTHASSAHGAGRTIYKIEPRHARLAVHAAHTATAFIIESWDRRKKRN